MKLVIALTGRAGSGKNTVCDMIRRYLPGCQSFAFASALKAIVSDLHIQSEQELTQILKKHLGADVFTRALLNELGKVNTQVVIITDLQFADELDQLMCFCTDRGIPLQTVRVHREQSSSECFYDRFATCLENDSTLGVLEERVRQLCGVWTKYFVPQYFDPVD